jgi:hypothetical protein
MLPELKDLTEKGLFTPVRIFFFIALMLARV